jgi:hypothetical protein
MLRPPIVVDLAPIYDHRQPLPLFVPAFMADLLAFRNGSRGVVRRHVDHRVVAMAPRRHM